MVGPSDASEDAELPHVDCVVQKGRVTHVSETSTQVSGFPPERFFGRLAWELVHPDDRPLILPFMAVGWTGQIDVAIRVQDSDGRWTWRRARGMRTIDASGEPSTRLTLKKIVR